MSCRCQPSSRPRDRSEGSDNQGHIELRGPGGTVYVCERSDAVRLGVATGCQPGTYDSDTLGRFFFLGFEPLLDCVASSWVMLPLTASSSSLFGVVNGAFYKIS